MTLSTKSLTPIPFGIDFSPKVGFPGGLVVKNLSANAGDIRGLWIFSPWVGKIPWRRKWQPTPGFLPGKFHEQGSLASYSPWGCKESDMTEHTCMPPSEGNWVWKGIWGKWRWVNVPEAPEGELVSFCSWVLRELGVSSEKRTFLPALTPSCRNFIFSDALYKS